MGFEFVDGFVYVIYFFLKMNVVGFVIIIGWLLFGYWMCRLFLGRLMCVLCCRWLCCIRVMVVVQVLLLQVRVLLILCLNMCRWVCVGFIIWVKFMFIECGNDVCCCSSEFMCLIGVVLIRLILIIVCGLFIDIVVKCMFLFCSGSRYFLCGWVKFISGMLVGLKVGMFIVIVNCFLFSVFILWLVSGLLMMNVLFCVLFLCISQVVMQCVLLLYCLELELLVFQMWYEVIEFFVCGVLMVRI